MWMLWRMCRMRCGLWKLGIPMVEVYTKTARQFGKPNVLNCYVTNIFPPTIEIELLKNGQKMDNLKMGFLTYTKDFAYFIVANAEFIPTEEDTFACRVKHPSLKEPMTVEWDRLM
ncbi:beta-2-microglobulin-like isoform X2 [Arvicanthis niloticus]|uniref:beta-2-microglobulin-like isoform X2 n=1 Tax=Arvicanthis niloticus TaxID=61156 RepID=UPI00402B1951